MNNYSKEELRKASKHVAYEMKVLINLVLLLKQSNEKSAGHNALVESFAIHSRNIIQFFWTDKPRKDDIVATQFVKSIEEWYKFRPIKTKLLEEAEYKAHKQVAHLTYTRLDFDLKNKEWKFVAIFNELCSCIDMFFKHVDINLLDQKMIDFILLFKQE